MVTIINNKNYNKYSKVLYLSTKGLFRCIQKPKSLQDSPSHRILRHMHGALNIDKKITNYTVYL